jgi:ParB-like chromosome segregation protein Spo0J
MGLDDIKVNPELGYKIHPFADAFPMMKGKELDDLVEDIRKNGQRDAIQYVEYLDAEGEPINADTAVYSPPDPLAERDREKVVIIDGRNRLRACRIAGIEPVFDPHYWNRTDEELLAYVWSKNLHRRHISASQRAMIATEHQSFIDAIAKTSAQRRKTTQGRPKKGAKKTERKVAPSKKTAAVAAETAKVSTRTMEQALAVKKSGNKKLINEVKAGTKSVSKAAKEVQQKRAPAKRKRSKHRDPNSPEAVADKLIAKHSPSWCMRLTRAIEKKLIDAGDVTIMTVDL